MITEAIILAGGLGTRLRSKVSELPKSMAPINGIPFLEHQLNYLNKYGIKTVYLAIGYLSETIINYFGDSFNGIEVKHVLEKEPLGTGGAIKQALNQTKTEEVLVLNGDTMFRVNFDDFYKSHKNQKADFSLALKPMTNFKRYGVVKLNKKHIVIGFEEKQYQQNGNINGGVYIINKSVFNTFEFPTKFSFEKEFLEKKYNSLKFNGYISHGYFLDIGIPADYEKAQIDFYNLKQIKNLKIDKSWTLFLDRDGVINKKRDNDYVKTISEFEFIDGSKNAISKFSKIFGKIVIVTNQQCVGKNIITTNELDEIHNYMLTEIKKANGSIDKIYYAPQLKEENSIYRKPNTGMADLAKKDFPSINFTKSILIGDSLSDIEFGNNKKMKTFLISNTPNSTANYTFSNLNEILSYFI